MCVVLSKSAIESPHDSEGEIVIVLIIELMVR